MTLKRYQNYPQSNKLIEWLLLKKTIAVQRIIDSLLSAKPTHFHLKRMSALQFYCRYYPAVLFCIISLFLNVNPTAAQLNNPALVSIDAIPESEVNLPIQIDLRPFYAIANNKVDTLFTSAGYPDNWVQAACDMRYKYSFRRSPMQFNLNGTTLTIGFTGYYKIVGSTRLCAGKTVLSPWTPECKCGFDEGERKVAISYTIQFVLLKNYKVQLKITRNEPRPLDKCTVCFWKQDITKTVMESLKKELDLSKAALEKSYGSIDLKPQFTKIWSQLSEPFSLNNMGWLQINPKAIRVNRLRGTGTQLDISIGLTAKPVLSIQKPESTSNVLPNISDYKKMQGFSIFIDGQLKYDSLSQLLTTQIKGKEFDFKKGFIKKKFVFEACKIIGLEKGRLKMEVKFSGTDNGIIKVTALPVFTEATKIFSLQKVTFDLSTKDAILKFADLFFSRKISDEIEAKARYNLTDYANMAKANFEKQMNQELIKGVKGSGSLSKITIASILPFPDFLLVRMYSTGSMAIQVNGGELNLISAK